MERKDGGLADDRQSKRGLHLIVSRKSQALAQPAARGRELGLLTGVSACFLLSGFAALLYQTAWLRQFSIVFGTSELAVAAVLAAYMGGLGAGAALAGRFLGRIRRPVLVYALLEGGVALAALCVPALLDGASWLHLKALGGLPELPESGGLAQPLYYLFVSFLILALPTGFMGATLPLLTRYAVYQDAQVGPRIAWLYGINTLGAVLGALTTAFLMLPALGLQATVWVGVAVNGLVFLVAALLALKQVPTTKRRERRSAAVSGRSASRTPAAEIPLARRAFWILPLILLSGANAFLYELLWTRLLNHLLGGTIYAFATMLASFLSGIAIGSLAAARLARGRERAGWMFAACQFAIGLTSAAVYFWLERRVPGAAGLAANASLAALVILPAALFVGATFPLAVRVLSDGAADASSATARVYAWNTLGAIAGSVLAGFFLIPWLGFEGAVRLAVGVNFGLGAATLLAISGAGLGALGGALAALLAVALHRPSPPLNLLSVSVVDSGRGGEPVFQAVGRSATVFMKRDGGYFHLRTNGLPEALIEPAGAAPIRHSQKWLTALPLVARPDAKDILIVGFGGGVAIEGAPPMVAAIDVIEIEPEVIAANRAVAERRRTDPLADERVKVIINDARNALTLTRKTYDLIASQPSHPWTAGASHLYTGEFVGLAKERLRPQGVFVQWINSRFVDAALLRTLAATLFSRFAEVRLYQPAPGALLFLASDGGLNLEAQAAKHGRPLTTAELHYASVGINAVEDLVVALQADTQGLRRFIGDAPANSDDDNRMALFSRSGGDGLSTEALFELMSPQDPLLNPESWLHQGPTAFNLPYVAERLIVQGFAARAAALGRRAPDRSAAMTIAGLGLRRAGRFEDAEAAFTQALREDPANDQARYALTRRHLGRLTEGATPARILAAAQALQGSAAAVARGWRLAKRRDWQGLARLDALLGRAEPTDLWYPQAVQLRADWRVQGSRQRRDHQDALRLLDRALMHSAATDLLVIRAAAAVRLGQAVAFTETAMQVQAQMAKKLDRTEEGGYPLGERDLEAMRSRTAGFIRQLASPFAAPAGTRAEQVRTQFEALSKRLGAQGAA